MTLLMATICVVAGIFALMVEGYRLEKLKQEYDEHIRRCQCDEVGGDYLP